MLSLAAHDLQIRLEQFDITLDGEELRAQLPLANLRLVGPVEHGVVHPERYDAGRRAEVHKAMKDEILHLERHPTASFTGRAVAKGTATPSRGPSPSWAAPPAGLRGAQGLAAPTGPASSSAQPVGHPAVPGHVGRIRLKDRLRIDARSPRGEAAA